MEAIEWAFAHVDDLIKIGLMVLGLFSAIARLTPTKADDAVLEKILGWVHILGLTKKEKANDKS